MALKKVYVNAIVLSLVALVVTLFVASNIDKNVGYLYGLFTAFVLFVFFGQDKLGGFSRGLLGVEFGGGTDWKGDVAIGFLAFIPFLLVSSFLGVAGIGIPRMTVLAVSGVGLLTTVFLPAVIEELVFRGGVNALLSFFGINRLVVFVLSSVLFAGFHVFAFSVGGYVSDANPFFAAFGFGLLSSFLSVYRNSLLPSIFLHMINNLVAVLQLVIAS